MDAEVQTRSESTRDLKGLGIVGVPTACDPRRPRFLVEPIAVAPGGGSFSFLFGVALGSSPWLRLVLEVDAQLCFFPCAVKMPKKRRNGGRNRHGRGHGRLVDCSHCMCKPAKASGGQRAQSVLEVKPCPCLAVLQDKAIGRFMVRNMVDAGGLNDLKAASAFEREFLFPGDFAAQARKEYTTRHPLSRSLRAPEALQQELLLRFVRGALAHRARAQRSAAPRA